MSKSVKIFRRSLVAACFVVLFSLAGCSSDNTTSASTGALPQPSVNCGGSSCVD